MAALVVGREDTLHLQSADACCVSEVLLKDERGTILKTEWKAAKPDELEVKVPLQNASAGTVKMLVKKFGLRDPDEIPLHTYAEAGRLDGFSIHAGDADGVLKGTRLDQVTSLEVSGIHFHPQTLSRSNQQDELKLLTSDAGADSKLHPGDAIAVHATLKDGRVQEFPNISAKPGNPRIDVWCGLVRVNSSRLLLQNYTGLWLLELPDLIEP